MNKENCKKLIKTELQADLVVILIMGISICLLTGLGVNIFHQWLHGLIITGLIIAASFGLLIGKFHGWLAGLISGLGTCFAVSAGIGIGIVLSLLVGAYHACWSLTILLFICKYLYFREIGLKN